MPTKNIKKYKYKPMERAINRFNKKNQYLPNNLIELIEIKMN